DGDAPPVTPDVFTTADGLRTNEFAGAVQPPAGKGRDGRLWFATYKGVAVIDPAAVTPNPVPPRVRIEAAVIDKKPIDLSGPAAMPPGGGELEFRYTALSFSTPERVRFRYKLEGFDADWIDAGPRRTAYYTNIPPGAYHFRVTACNAAGVWGEVGAGFEFTLAPHFSP